MTQYGEYNPMIRGQCDTSAFSTSKETIAGGYQQAWNLSCEFQIVSPKEIVKLKNS